MINPLPPADDTTLEIERLTHHFCMQYLEPMNDKVKIRYLFNLLVAIDQLGNAICGGNPDCTISARVGFNVIRITTAGRHYWKIIAAIIDFTFWPLQGWGHCYDAYKADEADTIDNNDGAIFRAMMTVVIVATCVPISILLYLIYPFRNIFLQSNENLLPKQK